MRSILPKFNSNVDNIHLTFRCDPRDEEALLEDYGFDLPRAVMSAVHRYEVQLGAVFPVHFVNDQENRIIATQLWMITSVKEDMINAEVAHNMNLTRNIFTRTCEPITEMQFFDHNADPEEEKVRPRKRAKKPKKTTAGKVDVTHMNPAQLQRLKKEATGKGFPPGTKLDVMIQTLRELDIAA